MSNTTLQQVLQPIEALAAVLGAGANFNLAAERLNKNGYDIPTQPEQAATYLTAAIAADPSFFSTAQQQIRTNVLMQVLKLFAKVQIQLEGTITKLDAYESMKAWKSITETLVTLSAPPAAASQVNFNSMEFFLAQVPPNVREAFLTLVDTSPAEATPFANNLLTTIDHEDYSNNDDGSIFPYLGHGDPDD